MVNWTVGPRHLESVVKVSNVQVIISSWAFLDRLENVDLDGVEDLLVMVEELSENYRSQINFALSSVQNADQIITLFSAKNPKMMRQCSYSPAEQKACPKVCLSRTTTY